MSNFGRLAAQALGYIPLDRFDLFAGRVRIARLRRKLAFCGERTMIGSGLFIERPEFVHLCEDVSTGPNVSIIGAGGAVIRAGAMVAAGTLIVTTQHDPAAEIMRRTGMHGKVEIGEHAWIGAGAILLPGVTIGRHALVGAGAVVTTDIPAYALAVGIPARVIRDRRDSGVKEAVCRE